jgi:hypothetical protein
MDAWAFFSDVSPPCAHVSTKTSVWDFVDGWLILEAF